MYVCSSQYVGEATLTFVLLLMLAVQGNSLPLHYASAYNTSEAVVRMVLDAYPEAVREGDRVSSAWSVVKVCRGSVV